MRHETKAAYNQNTMKRLYIYIVVDRTSQPYDSSYNN